MVEAAFSISNATPDISCPTTGEVCPAKELLVQLYTPHDRMDMSADMPFDDTNPMFDRAKLGIKLAEHSTWVRARGCAGPLAMSGEVAVCPPRREMDTNPVRQKAIWGIRKLMSKGRRQW